VATNCCTSIRRPSPDFLVQLMLQPSPMLSAAASQLTRPFLFSRRSDSKRGPRLSGSKTKGQGSFRTARISDGTYDGYDGAPRSMRALARTGSFARSISSQATYRDPFNGSELEQEHFLR
jgi:hypothetical protein